MRRLRRPSYDQIEMALMMNWLEDILDGDREFLDKLIERL